MKKKGEKTKRRKKQKENNTRIEKVLMVEVEKKEESGVQKAKVIRVTSAIRANKTRVYHENSTDQSTLETR